MALGCSSSLAHGDAMLFYFTALILQHSFLYRTISGWFLRYTIVLIRWMCVPWHRVLRVHSISFVLHTRIVCLFVQLFQLHHPHQWQKKQKFFWIQTTPFHTMSLWFCHQWILPYSFANAYVRVHHVCQVLILKSNFFFGISLLSIFVVESQKFQKIRNS